MRLCPDLIRVNSSPFRRCRTKRSGIGSKRRGATCRPACRARTRRRAMVSRHSPEHRQSDRRPAYRAPTTRSVRLAGDLHPIAIRVERHTLIVTIAGPSWSIQDRKAVFFQSPRQLVDLLDGTHRNCNVSQSHPLRARLQNNRRQLARLHHFNTRPALETEKYRSKALGWIGVLASGVRTKILRVKLFAPLQVRSPQGDMID